MRQTTKSVSLVMILNILFSAMAVYTENVEAGRCNYWKLFKL